MSGRRFLLSCMIAWAAMAACRAVAAPPNVLLVMADDLRCDLACLGGPAITPHLDRLAARGVLFERAYCQQAVCNPSRSSLLTGLRPDTLGLWCNSVHFRELRPLVTTLPLWFKEHGYTTRCVGKIFHNWHTAARGDRRSWSADEFLHYANHGDDAPQVDGGLPPSLAVVDRRYGKGPLDERRAVPDEAYYDGRVAAEAIRVLDEVGGGPFFLAVGFWKPHAPFNAPARYWDLYDRDRLPVLDPRRPTAVAEIAFHQSTEILGPPAAQRPPSDAEAAEMRHGYLAGISFLDAQVGRLLAALEAKGLADDTIVVFASDHGYHMGEHGLWGKTSTFELDARVPLVIADPRSGRAARKVRGIVELLDIFPTLVEACDLPMPAGLEGTSLVPVVRGTGDAVKQEAFTQHPRPAYFDRERDGRPQAMGYSVRTDRIRYTEWRDWASGATLAAELYDHATDPNELVNLASDATVDDLRADAARRLAARFPVQRH